MKHQVVTGWVWCTVYGMVHEEGREPDGMSSDECEGDHYKLYTRVEEIVEKVTAKLTKGDTG